MKTCLISTEGNHVPPHHRMVVDGFGLLVDLKGIRISAVDPSSFADPAIRRIEWGPVTVMVNGQAQTVERGTITRTDYSVQTFHEKELLNNYLHLYEEAKAKLLADHAAAVGAEKVAQERARLEQAAGRVRQQQQAQQQAVQAAFAEAENQRKIKEARDLAEEHKRVAAQVAADIARMKPADNSAFEAEQGAIRADEAAIAKARSTNTVDSFTEYLKTFRTHAVEATARIASLLSGVTRQ